MAVCEMNFVVVVQPHGPIVFQKVSFLEITKYPLQQYQ